MTAEIANPFVRMLTPVKQLLIVEGDVTFFESDMIGVLNYSLRGNSGFPAWELWIPCVGINKDPKAGIVKVTIVLPFSSE